MTLDPGVAKPRLSNVWNRAVDEHYVEPRWCSARLFQEEPFEGWIWDPACGFGHIVESAREAGFRTLASDIVDRGYPSDVSDFFDHRHDIDNIVTNPPFNLAEEFTRHAVKLARTKVAIVFPTARLNAARWIVRLPLCRVWLLTPRPSMPPGHVIARGEKPGGGKMDFCWLVFLKGYDGPASVHWLHRDREKTGVFE